MTTDLILGTAGHIDHGKTSLIRTLTGVDTDRLPEEKKRGITIDLGFAELAIGPFRLGIVDVPGHERFVRNMLAGASGIDLAMLVVAADDSIKPQTREHLDILRLLDLKTGVIAITKCDLVESEWIDLVEEEIRDLVSATFLQHATPNGPAIVRTSAATGEGIEALRKALRQACDHAASAHTSNADAAPFRMAIDRTFTMPGHGTVVTGSVGSGGAAVGDELTIEPGNVKVRVRGLQNHDRHTDRVCRGQRAAINLAGIHHDQIQRGQELATPGHLRPSRLLTIRFRTIHELQRTVKNRCRVRVHVGTAELLATLVLLDADQVAADQTAIAQLFLGDGAVTTWNQPLVVRNESPARTIGGGHVLLPESEKLPRGNPQVLLRIAQLESDDPVERASAAIFFAGLQDWQPSDLARTAGIEQIASVMECLLSQGTLCDVPISPTRTVQIHRDVLAELSHRIERALTVIHQRFPLRTSLDRSVVEQGFNYVNRNLLKHLLASMQKAGTIRLSADQISLKGHGPKLSQNERKLLAKLADDYRVAGIEAPTVRQIQQRTAKNQNAVPQLVALAAANGDLVEITAEYYLHADVDRNLQSLLAERLAENPGEGQGATLSEIREILSTSRKYAVPYCEYLDRIGFTRREGDLRFLIRSGQGGQGQ